MAESNRKRKGPTDDGPVSVDYSEGHPSINQLVAEQGISRIEDVATLHGDFWPPEESVEAFLEALHDWRGHRRTDPAA